MELPAGHYDATDPPAPYLVPAGPLLARAAVGPATAHRAMPETLARMWADERTRVLRIDAGRAPVSDDAGRLVLVATKDIAGNGPDAEGCYFLGVDAGKVAYFAVDAPFTPGPGESAVTLRAVGPRLTPHDCGLFAHAAALAGWHARSRFCGSCGAATAAGGGGHMRRCAGCSTQHFPRTDPAVIALVQDEAGRVLLARNATWPECRFSTIAGFLEPGEAVEAAVAREVFEETGLTVDEVQYQGSQPWPFPRSVMLAFTAGVSDTTVRVCSAELSETRWFSRPQLLAAVRAGTVRLPSAASIARWQVEGWLGFAIDANQDW